MLCWDELGLDHDGIFSGYHGYLGFFFVFMGWETVEA